MELSPELYCLNFILKTTHHFHSCSYRDCKRFPSFSSVASDFFPLVHKVSFRYHIILGG